jgi:hypothetical protein
MSQSSEGVAQRNQRKTSRPKATRYGCSRGPYRIKVKTEWRDFRFFNPLPTESRNYPVPIPEQASRISASPTVAKSSAISIAVRPNPFPCSTKKPTTKPPRKELDFTDLPRSVFIRRVSMEMNVSAAAADPLATIPLRKLDFSDFGQVPLLARVSPLRYSPASFRDGPYTEQLS